MFSLPLRPSLPTLTFILSTDRLSHLSNRNTPTALVVIVPLNREQPCWKRLGSWLVSMGLNHWSTTGCTLTRGMAAVSPSSPTTGYEAADCSSQLPAWPALHSGSSKIPVVFLSFRPCPGLTFRTCTKRCCDDRRHAADTDKHQPTRGPQDIDHIMALSPAVRAVWVFCPGEPCKRYASS